ncbi:hypothetical protein [Novosphingobium sp. Leaf2]|uniref:hypothetical protein n=1 Tax=Novosphingobium sp. Leaf2 TaxID=1735670 RepID=UPI0006FCC751|nr:hypothetical protein [Novosphingobium sp. Leaf2]KQM21530.1 hypothetical protein ASE49_14060 [Novosphingobium sp. Leaf2]
MTGVTDRRCPGSFHHAPIGKAGIQRWRPSTGATSTAWRFNGGRERRNEGGVRIEVETNRIVTDRATARSRG